ncbi:MAG: hypothetical protein JWR09_3771, partial [Mucilaginibacter sp.]|nr:hypothetical protein [Mucilaginibacter sp.]
KLLWEHDKYQADLIDPICRLLDKRGLSYKFIRYGFYTHQDLAENLKKVRGVIFLCESESQGFAYQQILATGTPILAWDRAGYWQDPYYFPDKVKFGPVSSTPYWDERCGFKFEGIADFEGQLVKFNSKLGLFKPRDYITENLSLEKCAEKYLEVYRQVLNELA